jgi:hypothetical protein
MLLAELSPLDVRQLFICHKELFYDAYRGWPEVQRAFVADYLEREYQIDNVGARQALFGPEPDMTGPAGVAPGHPVREAAEIIGPWGAVRKVGP